jgi:hypothetical protein
MLLKNWYLCVDKTVLDLLMGAGWFPFVDGTEWQATICAERARSSHGENPALFRVAEGAYPGYFP